VEGLAALGWRVPSPAATFYVWAPAPGGDDVAFAGTLLEEAGVVVVPGSGYGAAGRGYVRLCLTVGEEEIRLALERLAPLADRLAPTP
jgi:LL-diaminopimelate aminotransferase